MVSLADNLLSVLGLLGTASFMIVVALSVLSFKFFKPQAASTKQKSIAAKVIFGVVMGILAIFGTLWGMKLADGTIINVRELAAMIAGAAGGPIGGTIAGLMGGIHRFTAGGATALPCTISTVTIGIIAGLLATRISGKWYLVKAAVLGLALESMAMGLILLLVGNGVAIVDKIYFSMIGANTIGFVLWVYLANKFRQSQNETSHKKIE